MARNLGNGGYFLRSSGPFLPIDGSIRVLRGLSCWVRFNSLPSRVMRFITLGPSQSLVLRYETTNTLRFYVNGTAWGDIQGSFTFVANRWYHIFGQAVDSDTSTRLYIDGSQIAASGPANFANGAVSCTAVQLSADVSTSEWFDGSIADVALWGNVLPDVQIASLARGLSPLAIQNTFLHSYFPLLDQRGGVSDYYGFPLTETNGPVPFIAQPPQLSVPSIRAKERPIFSVYDWTDAVIVSAPSIPPAVSANVRSNKLRPRIFAPGLAR